MMSKNLGDLRTELLQTPDVRAAYDAQAPEYAAARVVMQTEAEQVQALAELNKEAKRLGLE